VVQSTDLEGAHKVTFKNQLSFRQKWLVKLSFQISPQYKKKFCIIFEWKIIQKIFYLLTYCSTCQCDLTITNYKAMGLIFLLLHVTSAREVPLPLLYFFMDLTVSSFMFHSFFAHSKSIDLVGMWWLPFLWIYSSLYLS